MKENSRSSIETGQWKFFFYMCTSCTTLILNKNKRLLSRPRTWRQSITDRRTHPQRLGGGDTSNFVPPKIRWWFRSCLFLCFYNRLLYCREKAVINLTQMRKFWTKMCQNWQSGSHCWRNLSAPLDLLAMRCPICNSGRNRRGGDASQVGNMGRKQQQQRRRHLLDYGSQEAGLVAKKHSHNKNMEKHKGESVTVTDHWKSAYGIKEFLYRDVRARTVGYLLVAVASLGGAPGDTLQGVTPEGKKLWANLQRIVEKRGRTGKKGVGWHPGGVTPE